MCVYLCTKCNFTLPTHNRPLKSPPRIGLDRTIKSFPLDLFDEDDNFISNITSLSDFLIIYNSNFILRNDPGYVLKVMFKRRKKMWF